MLDRQQPFSRRGFCLYCGGTATFATTGGWLRPSPAFAEARSICNPLAPGEVMSAATTRDQLAQLFRETSDAHETAFAATHGEDPNWSVWYADHLAGPLSQCLGTDLPADSLVADLRAVDQAQRATPTADWPEYYATWFLERYRSH